MNFIEELTWRGMIHDVMPGAKEQLEKEMTAGYLGIDPTADSLHIGHLVGVMILRHFQRCGHKPIALVGGATGMIGDPSGKSQERNLLDELTLRHNQECIKKQLEIFLKFSNYENLLYKLTSIEVTDESSKDEITRAKNALRYLYKYRNTKDSQTKRNNKVRFDLLVKGKFGISKQELLSLVEEKDNVAELVNNYDWMRKFSFLSFIRDIGKHITVNYMMAKDSVKKRLSGETSDGMSFTEFTYQLVQGYDFLYLYQHHNCRIQMGGSDQWGNITTGTELIRRKTGGEAFALTCPLITKADGGKFGKTESGNVWLDRRYTSPYKFYQFWLNVSDTDAEKYIKIFTFLEKEEIEALIEEQRQAPHLRPLQKALAKEVTTMVHSEADYLAAVDASSILFGNSTSDQLKKLDEETFLAVFEGVPQFEISLAELNEGIKAIDLLTEKSAVFPSKGEMRKMTQGGGVAINKEKLAQPDAVVTVDQLLNGRYLLVQKGKKNYYLLTAK